MSRLEERIHFQNEQVYVEIAMGFDMPIKYYFFTIHGGKDLDCMSVLLDVSTSPNPPFYRLSAAEFGYMLNILGFTDKVLPLTQKVISYDLPILEDDSVKQEFKKACNAVFPSTEAIVASLLRLYNSRDFRSHKSAGIINLYYTRSKNLLGRQAEQESEVKHEE